MNEETKAQEMKQVNVEKKGEMLDHMEISSGSAAKGMNITLKTYYNSLNIDEAQQKIENTLKIRQYLISKQIM